LSLGGGIWARSRRASGPDRLARQSWRSRRASLTWTGGTIDRFAGCGSNPGTVTRRGNTAQIFIAERWTRRGDVFHQNISESSAAGVAEDALEHYLLLPILPSSRHCLDDFSFSPLLSLYYRQVLPTSMLTSLRIDFFLTSSVSYPNHICTWSSCIGRVEL
jgi:hypothetical protein